MEYQNVKKYMLLTFLFMKRQKSYGELPWTKVRNIVVVDDQQPERGGAMEKKKRRNCFFL